MDCLWNAARDAAVKVFKGMRVKQLIPPDKNSSLWQVITNKSTFWTRKVMVATGSNPRIWNLLEEMGHTIIPPVPSLFTFNIKDSRIKGLLGVSVENAKINVVGVKLQAIGPLLITHWGLSGPAILKLSAWGARHLHQKEYKFSILVNWLFPYTTQEVKEHLNAAKERFRKKQVQTNAQFGLPLRLWKSLVTASKLQQ